MEAAPPAETQAPARAWAPRLAVFAGALVAGLVLGATTALLIVPGAAQKVAADPRLPPAAAGAIAWLPDRGLSILQPARSPLRVEAVAVRRAVPAGGFAFEVTGEVRNPSGQPLRAPMVELRLMGADGRMIETRRVPLADEQVLAGGGVAFSTVALNVPADATRLAVALRPGPALPY